MATTLTLFPSRIRFTNADGTLTPEAYRALQMLIVRVGGPIAPTINELDAQQYADAGIEEGKAAFFAFMNEVGSTPPAAPLVQTYDQTPATAEPVQIEHLVTEVAAMREDIALLMTQINDINQRVEL